MKALPSFAATVVIYGCKNFMKWRRKEVVDESYASLSHISKDRKNGATTLRQMTLRKTIFAN
jgi:hypothetical protein